MTRRLPLLLLLVPLAFPARAVELGPVRPEPGTRGVARTAIDGRAIVEIPVTFLGTLDDQFGPDLDLHLVRLEGPVADSVGVASGMSGSPVYIDGALVGALAYRMGSLPTTPVAGVTPIRDMLAADRGAGAVPDGPYGSPDDGDVRPIGTPVHVAGLRGPLRTWASERFAEHGMRLVVGASGAPGASGAAGAAAGPDTLVPGAPVGVGLALGDLAITATGTVTHVDGDRVWAFGHPFLGGGRVAMPMVEAEVVHTLADLVGSVKLARTGPEIGAILEDRLSAVVGQRGARARMIPVGLRLHTAGGAVESLDVRVVDGSDLTPLLLGVVAASALSNRIGFESESTIHTRTEVRIADHDPLALETMHSGRFGAATIGLADELQSAVASLWDNPYEPLRIEGVDVEVHVDDERREYRLVDVGFDRGALVPGQTLSVRCVLEAFRGPPREVELQLVVPPGLRHERLALAVGAPADVARALGRRDLRRAASAVDLDALLAARGEGVGAHRLTAVLYRFADGIAHRGMRLEDLPPTARRLVGGGTRLRRNLAERIREYDRTEQALDGPITGGLVVGLRLDPDRPAEEDAR